MLIVVMIYELNLRHLRAFVATTKLGSVSAAARAVNVTQPAITQALAKLEGQLGVVLFTRTSAGTVVTEAARLFAPRAEAALAHVASPRVTMVQLRAFVALADAGSYPQASTATGLAQPSLHRAVHDLGVALRRALLVRSGRGLTLTEAGRRTLRGFRLARAELAAGLSELAALQGRETGRITVGAMPLSRARLLPEAVTRFHRQHPDAVVAVLEGSYAELVEPLRDGIADLLIGALRERSAGEGLVQQALFEDRPVVIGRTGHPLVGQHVRPELLAAYPWAVAAPGTPLRQQWQRMFEDAGVVPPVVPAECGSVLVIRQILRGSDFLTLLSPDQVAVELEAGLLDIICPAPPTLTRTIGVTIRSGWRPTALQRAFVETLARSVSKTL